VIVVLWMYRARLDHDDSDADANQGLATTSETVVVDSVHPRHTLRMSAPRECELIAPGDPLLAVSRLSVELALLARSRWAGNGGSPSSPRWSWDPAQDDAVREQRNQSAHAALVQADQGVDLEHARPQAGRHSRLASTAPLLCIRRSDPGLKWSRAGESNNSCRQECTQYEALFAAVGVRLTQHHKTLCQIDLNEARRG